MPDGSLSVALPHIASLEPPYGELYTTWRFQSNGALHDRMYIQLKDPASGRSTTTTYARYLFQVDYWKKHQQWIPEGYEVDHIDNNPR